MRDIIEQINGLLGPIENNDDIIFEKMAQFIMDLEPDQLSDNELDEVINIIDDLEMDAGIEEQARATRRAKRTDPSKRQAAKRYYRANRSRIKRRKARFKRSAEGRKRERQKKRMARVGKTATGRRKVRYHVRGKSRK